MTRQLLTRGMIAGVIAAILMTLFARFFAEPQVDLAIAYETHHDAQAHHHMAADAMPAAAEEPELVSRTTQKGLGLLTALTLYGAAIGGIFSLVFATSYGRIGTIGPRSLSLLLALGGFIAIALIPALQYPPTPPAVGQHETVAFRTLAYFTMIGLSLAALIMAIRIGRGLTQRIGAFNAMLSAAALYIAVIIVAGYVMPVINEVPADFPAVLLWKFRIASIETQALLWSVIGIVFGSMAESVLRGSPGSAGAR